MLDKLKEFFSSPYAAPLTEPAHNVISIARAPLNGFIRAFRESLEDAKDYKQWPVEFYGRLLGDDDYDESPAGIMTLIGGVGSGLAGLIGGGFVAANLAAGMGMAATAGTVIAGAIGTAVIGLATGPFIMAGVVGAVALTVGLVVGAVPGFIAGLYKAVKHALASRPAPEPEAPAPVVKPAVVPPAPARRATPVEEAMDAIMRLSAEEKERLDARLKGSFEKPAAKESAEEGPRPVPEFNKGGGFEKLGKLGAT